MVCSCCGKQKAELHPKKSKLMKSMTLYVCNDCDKKNMEPRSLVILYGRRFGAESVSVYIEKRRYHGDEILARELVA